MKTYKVKASTLAEYIELPLEQRERRVWWWLTKWYIEPYAMVWSSAQIKGNNESEWSKFSDYVKEFYPVQRWLREEVHFFLVYDVCYRFNRWKNRIRNRIVHPRKEMRKAVFPNDWQDLVPTIVNFHLQCVIEFVDREKCFEFTVYDGEGVPKETKRFAAELREAYDYAKKGRAILQAEIEKAYDRVPVQSFGNYEELYKEVNEKEAWLEECDTKFCKWVVENRAYFWV